MYEYIENIHNLQVRDIPNRIFKYYSLTDNSIANIINNKIWLSKPTSFNDPFDCHFYYNAMEYGKYVVMQDDILFKEQESIKNVNNIQKEIDKKLNYLYENEAQKSILKYKNNILVSSFSENNDIRLMWSHYTDNHQGICVEYNTNKFKNELFKVLYTNNIIDMTNGLLSKIPYTNFWFFPMLRKDKVWSYEKEWRIIAINKDLKQNGHNMQLTPSSVYMGTKITKQNQEMLINICKSQKINLYKMKMVNKEYKLICDKSKDYSKL